MLVAQKLRLQPECQSHREELVTSAQQILLDTTKVRLMSAGWLVDLGGEFIARRPGRGMAFSQRTPSQERILPKFLPRSQAEFIVNLINWLGVEAATGSWVDILSEGL